MRCTNCGGLVEMTNSPPETEEGQSFLEQYQCIECEKYGAIHGVVGEPVDSWDFRGILS